MIYSKLPSDLRLNIFPIYMAVTNLAAFIVFAIDKKLAKLVAPRIPEKTLILLCVIGGSVGGLVSMYVFQHKTLHKKFAVGIPLILLVQLIAVLVFLLFLETPLWPAY